jgi:hypothetical protein
LFSYTFVSAESKVFTAASCNKELKRFRVDSQSTAKG